MIQPRHHIFLGRPGMIPTSTTVHTIFIKKLSYPFTSRPDELWIVERTADGRETWKPVETFLENMHLTRDRATLRTTANNWRQYYDIPISSSSSSTATPSPVLPHPEHSNVSVSQPFDAHPRSTPHSPILLGTLCSTSFTGHHHFVILATMEIYTTILTINHTSPDPTIEPPYYNRTSASPTSTS